MTKNLIPQIAKMLGVEFGEPFKIKGCDGLIYKFDSDGLKATRDDGAETFVATTFVALLSGGLEIVKLPWKPKVGGVYYTFCVDWKSYVESYVWRVSNGFWDDSPADFALFKAGLVFQTKEEAEVALPKVAAEMGVDYEL